MHILCASLLLTLLMVAQFCSTFFFLLHSCAPILQLCHRHLFSYCKTPFKDFFLSCLQKKKKKSESLHLCSKTCIAASLFFGFAVPPLQGTSVTLGVPPPLSLEKFWIMSCAKSIDRTLHIFAFQFLVHNSQVVLLFHV